MKNIQNIAKTYMLNAGLVLTVPAMAQYHLPEFLNQKMVRDTAYVPAVFYIHGVETDSLIRTDYIRGYKQHVKKIGTLYENIKPVVVVGADSTGSSVDQLNAATAQLSHDDYRLVIVDSHGYRQTEFKPDSQGRVVPDVKHMTAIYQGENKPADIHTASLIKQFARRSQRTDVILSECAAGKAVSETLQAGFLPDHSILLSLADTAQTDDYDATYRFFACVNEINKYQLPQGGSLIPHLVGDYLLKAKDTQLNEAITIGIAGPKPKMWVINPQDYRAVFADFTKEDNDKLKAKIMTRLQTRYGHSADKFEMEQYMDELQDCMINQDNNPKEHTPHFRGFTMFVMMEHLGVHEALEKAGRMNFPPKYNVPLYSP